ncbi:hypothetical protein U5801_00870 [Lamprobacter modestohalophilus]|uniref:hypothetical protein n=1 Tax=Lamprobacter modestohalophilus TaxID=1064514 RepID=UPI002ADECE74|nr:hypothetical protein [Lamprobacter modestohalophilus]MEA1048375.1 hypothetical protein [Lamprobacter modestohalophilus]
MENKLIQLAFTVPLMLVSFCSSGACFISDQPANCRYPAGDSWCRSNNDFTPYAYNDDCLAKNTAFGVGSIDKNLPKTVQDHVIKLSEYCTDVGGKFMDPSPAIQSGDFNGDSKLDYAVYEGDFTCEDAFSTYGGSGGSQVSFFVSSPSGYRKAGGNAAGGVSVEGQRIWLGLCGPYCGDPNFASKAGAKCCERAFTWNKSKGAIILDQSIQQRDQ